MKRGRRPRTPDEIKQAFWAHVEKAAGPDGCWLWIGRKDTYGYGVFRALGERSAHRVSFVLNKGPIPKGMCVCHECDNPPCIRPDHLFAGTRKQNQEDMKQKLRGTHGPKNRHVKLDASDVMRIRLLYSAGNVGMTALAQEFLVSVEQVRRIVDGERWAHLPVLSSPQGRGLRTRIAFGKEVDESADYTKCGRGI